MFSLGTRGQRRRRTKSSGFTRLCGTSWTMLKERSKHVSSLAQREAKSKSRASASMRQLRDVQSQLDEKQQLLDSKDGDLSHAAGQDN